MAISQITNASIAGLGYGFKNRIINGAMMIDQRNAGASFTVGNLGYGIDRWLTQAVTASGTGQRVTGSTGNNNALRITGATGNTTIQVSQRIESVNIYDCASQTVTVSFILYGSSSGSVSVRFLYPTATDNYTSVTEPVGGTTVNFTTTPTTYTVTRTLDANANKGVWVLLDFGAVGNAVTRTLEFVQLEKGSTATSFDYRPYGTELALCQRYCLLLGGNNGQSGLGAGIWYATTATVHQMQFPVQMRVAPTLSYSSVTVTMYYAGAAATSTAPTLNTVSATSAEFYTPIASGSVTAGWGTSVRVTAGQCILSSEL